MRKTKVLVTTMALVASMSITTFAGEWKQDATGWWYQNDDGSYPVNQWQEIGGKQYYFNETGYMLVNTVTPDGKQVGSDGAMIQAPLFDYDIEDCHATYVKHEISTDYEGNPCVIIYYNYTNKKDEERSAMGNSCYIEAYQNGVECDHATISYSVKNQAIENHYKSVLPGTTIEVAEAFKISDDSDITLILKDIFDWSDKSPKITVTFPLK